MNSNLREKLLIIVSFLFVSWIVSCLSDYFSGEAFVKFVARYDSAISKAGKKSILYIYHNPDELIGMNIPFISPFKLKNNEFFRSEPSRYLYSVHTSSKNETVNVKDNDIELKYQNNPFPGFFFLRFSKNYDDDNLPVGREQRFYGSKEPTIVGDIYFSSKGAFWYYICLTGVVSLLIGLIIPDAFRYFHKDRFIKN